MASIEPRGKNSFRLIVENGYDAKGKRDRRKKTIRIEDPKLLKTKRKLQEYLEDQLHRFRIEVEAGEYIAPEKSTFDSFAEKWVEKKLFNKNGKPYSFTTSVKYSNHLKNHILPALGHKKIDKIKSLHIVDFIDDLSKDGARKDGKPGGLGDQTIKDIFKILQALFKTATEEWKLIKDDPIEGLSSPEAENKEMNFLESDEAAECIKVLYEIDIKWRLYYLAALIGGLRRGEALACEWHLDIDWDKGGIYVNRSISKTINGEPHVKSPKSKSSQRFVKMPDFYMNELAKYYRLWKKEKLLLGDAWEGGEHQYVFHSGKGKPYYYTTPTAKWTKIKKKYGLKDVRLHDLRHTMVALLMEAGESLSAIQRRAGHASARTTSDIYGHVTEKLENSTVKHFNQFDPRNLAQKQS
ncbi:tyrosine-type recombinase/integrase [Bacillus velezensis]|uniref:tyrosine-type recombinase/integrase n=1 Tax=Bacillus velezensis TaxID=492670 RepID=UPI002DB9C742|nr:site-specific integrase [Bacillus velezensis]MEC3613106.1 site-specific integrase [Bacillus velezensis]MEC3677833.1 site-specific integrase [Bacillus velezensis]